VAVVWRSVVGQELIVNECEYNIEISISWLRNKFMKLYRTLEYTIITIGLIWLGVEVLYFSNFEASYSIDHCCTDGNMILKTENLPITKHMALEVKDWRKSIGSSGMTKHFPLTLWIFDWKQKKTPDRESWWTDHYHVLFLFSESDPRLQDAKHWPDIHVGVALV